MRLNVMRWLILTSIIALVAGCASYKVNRDSSGKVLSVDSYGFLRTIKVSEHIKYDTTGKVVLEEDRTVETSSNTGEVMNAGNELLGTTVGAAKSLIP